MAAPGRSTTSASDAATTAMRGNDHDFDSRYDLYKPKATQKFAYDEYGNLRVYDGDGWDRDWDGRDWRKRRDWDKWDWDDKAKRKRPSTR